MLNSVNIMGRVMGDLTVKTTDSGNRFCLFSLAHTRDTLTETGEKMVDYIDCIAWNALAEYIVENFKKGDAMVVDGKLQVHFYKTNAGGERNKSTEIFVEHVYFASKRIYVDESGISYTYGNED